MPTKTKTPVQEAIAAASKVGSAKRLEILVAIHGAEDPISPNVYTKTIGSGTLGANSYHFRRLAADGYIKVAKEVRKRGAIEHLYRPTAKGRRIAEKLT